MSRFNLDNFFAALRNLSVRGTFSSFTGRSSSSVRECQQETHRSYDCADEEARFEPEHSCERQEPTRTSRRNRRVRTQRQEDTCQPSCRHTEQKPVQQETCECRKETKPVRDRGCQPQLPECECEPEIPAIEMPSINVNKQVAINNGIFDGQGDDIYDGPGDDIYVRELNINTYNNTTNISRPTVEPTVEPTIEPTEDPTIDPGTEDPEPTVDLMPLRNLLNLLDGINMDGQLNDNELTKAMQNPNIADLDGDNTKISSEELAIFNRIKAFNQDKDLISNVIKGNYKNISESTLNSLQKLSDDIKELTKKRNS